MKTRKFIQLIVILGAAIIGIACNLQTAAPTTPNFVPTATPEGSILDPSSQAPDSLPSPTWTQELTQILTATFTPSLTPTFTTAPVTMTAGQRLSCVKGPHYILYEWVTAIEMGDTVTLTARSTPDWPDYYYVRKSDGTECWAYGASSTVHGDPSSLPLRDAPPLPTVTLLIENKTHIALGDVYIRGKDESLWGADRLGAATIAPGTTFSLNLTAGFYDLQIRDIHLQALFEKENTAIGPDLSTRRISVDFAIAFRLQNASAALHLCRIQFTPTDGSGVLEIPIPGDGVLGPGEEMTFDLRVGIYNYKMYRCGDNAVMATGTGLYYGPFPNGLVLH